MWMWKETTKNAAYANTVLHLRGPQVCVVGDVRSLSAPSWSARIQLSDAALNFVLSPLHPMEKRSQGRMRYTESTVETAVKPLSMICSPGTRVIVMRPKTRWEIAVNPSAGEVFCQLT